MLNETFHCQPPIAKKYQQYAPKEASTTKNCLAEGVCMFQLSTRFCQAPFCWADNAPKSQCKRQCQNPVSVSFFCDRFMTAQSEIKFSVKEKNPLSGAIMQKRCGYSCDKSHSNEWYFNVEAILWTQLWLELSCSSSHTRSTVDVPLTEVDCPQSRTQRPMGWVTLSLWCIIRMLWLIAYELSLRILGTP